MMKPNLKKFKIPSKKTLPVDDFIEKILYEPEIGYYSRKDPFGKNGDFITSPTISNLFSEIIGIWLVSAWEKMGKPKIFNFVELGPGDGSLTKVIISTLKKFPELNKAIKIYLYEKSIFLKVIQKQNIDNKHIKWIKNFKSIKKGPVIFFGNEFFDAIPIKQFSNINNEWFEKCYVVKNNIDVIEKFVRSKKKDVAQIMNFGTLKKLKFIEFPKKGFLELNPIINKISELSGGILLIDYGYLNINNSNTIQAVMNNKRISTRTMLKNLGNADITSLVNFNLLKEYFLKNNLKVKKIVTQRFFLERMGIIERAHILEKKKNNV
jgi:NADH dehydrogenase [ubiquinone] 1 alpha subcomplex assembly factor 7